MTQQNAPHPRMHGISHVTGGPDPIPGLMPSFSTYPGLIQATPGLWAYWPLSDTGGLEFDELVAGRALTGEESPYAAPYDYSFTYGLPGPIVGDPSTAIGFIGRDTTDPTEGTRAWYEFVSGDDADDVLGGTSTYTVELWFYPNIPVVENVASNTSFHGYLFSAGDNVFANAALNLYLDTDGSLTLIRGATTIVSSDSPAVQGWNHAAVVYDGTTLTLYLNGSAVGATATAASVTATAGYLFQIGLNTFSGTQAFFEGALAHVAIYTEPLDAEMIARHAAGEQITPSEGWVLGIDDDGDPEWQPPGVSVEHGGGEPDASPMPPPFGVAAPAGPTSVSGWHLNQHIELCVLYDNTPGRFDVPSMKWTRVPFNAIRLHRLWETSPGVTTSAWLPDDRGLSEQAKQGLLHIGAGMEGVADPDGSHTYEWWFTPEWPFLDWAKLPNFGDPAGVDAYVRAGRLLNASTGSVMRGSPGSSDRRFFEWGFFIPADGTPEWVDGATDNPYPIYPSDPDRPLRLPDPYPKLSDSVSGEMYAPGKTVEGAANLTVGTNLALQVWQDSPWPLRFSTDVYRIPYAGVAEWTKRPYLFVDYLYDPETIDHDTGLLLG